MNNPIFHVPCTLFRGYLMANALQREAVLYDVLYCSMYREWLRLEKIADDRKRFETACTNLGMMSTRMETSKALETGKRLYNAGIGEACFNIANYLLRKQMREQEKQTNEERALFVAYLALGSILGNKEYTKTNNSMWLSRMDGSTQAKKPLRSNCATFSPPVERYNSLYKTRRLRALLYDYYGVSFFADGVRGFYFSFTMDMEELVKAVKEKKSESPLSKFKEAKRKALESSTKTATKTATMAATLKDPF